MTQLRDKAAIELALAVVNSAHAKQIYGDEPVEKVTVSCIDVYGDYNLATARQLMKENILSSPLKKEQLLSSLKGLVVEYLKEDDLNSYTISELKFDSCNETDLRWIEMTANVNLKVPTYELPRIRKRELDLAKNLACDFVNILLQRYENKLEKQKKGTDNTNLSASVSWPPGLGSKSCKQLLKSKGKGLVVEAIERFIPHLLKEKGYISTDWNVKLIEEYSYDYIELRVDGKLVPCSENENLANSQSILSRLKKSFLGI